MEARIERIEISSYKVPTDFPESDGTLEWNSTTMNLVTLYAANKSGLGYSYGNSAVAKLIHSKLSSHVEGKDVFDLPEIWKSMVGTIRNQGRPGISSMAIAAVDNALWDLKARLLDLPLVRLLGRVRDRIPVYGSGGFTSYPIDRLQKQLAGWVEEGIKMVKMKVGRRPWEDAGRVRAAREAIGPDVQLFVDANGAYDRKQALAFAERFSQFGVNWYEEPVRSEDLEGLNLVRRGAPSSMEISSGEYGYDLSYFHHMLQAEAVDVVQADITRCAGLSEFMRVGALCGARGMPMSCHTAPNLHLPIGCTLQPMRHLEYFHDHVRIEQMFFDGARKPIQGLLTPDLSRPGLGLEFKTPDAKKFEIS